VVYTRRLNGSEVQAKVFRKVPHTIRVGDDLEWRRTLTGVEPIDEATDASPLHVAL